MSGGLITTGSFAKALWPGVNAWYGMEYNDYTPVYDKIFTVKRSRKAFEEVIGSTGFGLAVAKPEGDSIIYDAARQGFITRFQHVVYALGFIITREMMDDDQYDTVGKMRAQNLARSMRQTREIVAANILNRAFSSSFPYSNAGYQLIGTAQPNYAGGTFSNTLATPSDLSEAALEQAVIDISYFTDDRGLRIGVKPGKLVIPNTLQFEANRILKSQGRVGTDNNDINALRQMGMFTDIVASPYLTDLDAWFIITDVENGLTLFERDPDSFEMDNDFDTENAKFKARSRFSVGVADPRSIYGSAGA